MMLVFRSNLGRLPAMGVLLAFGACTAMGTNTGNGDQGGTGGVPAFHPAGGGLGFNVNPATGGAANATGGSPNCPVNACEGPVIVHAPNDVILRGTVELDTQLSGASAASSGNSAPLAALVFSGWRTESTDGGCRYDVTHPPETIRLCITSAADAWVDVTGLLHVHDEPIAGCTGPTTSEPWGLDMTLSEAGMLMATVFPQSNAQDAGAPTPSYSMNGQVDGYVVIGPSGENLPRIIPVGDGGTFTFPTAPIRSHSCSP